MSRMARKGTLNARSSIDRVANDLKSVADRIRGLPATFMRDALLCELNGIADAIADLMARADDHSIKVSK